MTWDDDRLSQLRFDAVFDVDPTTATIVLELTSPAGAVTTHAADWTGAATTRSRWNAARRETVTEWTRSALTAEQFGGVSVAAGSGRVLLTAGQWLGQWLVTVGGTVIPSQPFRIVVTPA